MNVPHLHVVTDDEVLSDPAFRDRAVAVMESWGPRVAVHLRSPGGPVSLLLDHAEALRPVSRAVGSRVLVNGRPDVVLAADADGVQLGARSIPVQAARSVLGAERLVGYSAHGAAEAVSALANGADFVLQGTIWETASHPDRAGVGLDPLRDAAARAEGPILAIGGATPARAGDAVSAGAWGVAVIRGVWEAADPVAAVGAYLEAMGVESA